MKKPFYLLVFVLVLSLVYATSQTSGSSSSPSTTSPSNDQTTSQPSGATSTPAQSQSSGSMSGSAGAQTGTTGTTGAQSGSTGTAGSMGTSASAGTDIQGQVENALKNEPTLSNDSITVSVTDDTINLSGTVASGKEKQTAKRIAQSYAGNRKVKEHLTVSGKGNNSMGTSDRDRGTGTSNPSGNTGSKPPSSDTGNSPSNPEGNKTNPPSGTQPPQR